MKSLKKSLKLIWWDLIFNCKGQYLIKKTDPIKVEVKLKIGFNKEVFLIVNIKLIWYSVMGFGKMQTILKIEMNMKVS